MANRIKVWPIGTTERISNVAVTNDKKTEKKEPHIVLEILNDYCSSSTLHGINYLGAKDKNPVEKIWWVMMFVLSVAACAFLISQTWTKWKENPVIISFHKEQISISEIPFPAITICPLNKIVQYKYNYTENFRNRYNLSGEDYKLFSDLSLVCEVADRFKSTTINFTDESAIDSIRKMAAQETIQSLFWQNEETIFVSSYFTDQLTEDGLCLSFNTLSQKDMFTDQINKNTNYIEQEFMNDGWNMEDGYLPELNMSAYPRRTAKDGRMHGLSILLTTRANELDYVCGFPVSGYKITLHNPAETPRVLEQFFLIPLRKQVSIIVRPELTKTDKNVRSLPPHTRKCYFSDEKSLRFFKVYTQNNCRVECEANISQHYCGCVPFYMPRDDKTRICGLGKIDCLRKVESAVRDFEVQNCDCLPSCSSLQYTAETSQTNVHLVEQILASGFWDNNSLGYLNQFTEGSVIPSIVDIFFKESQFLALQRSELYGQTDFLANCGGLLGLFMGFSLLSFLEIIYFFTIRLWFKYQIRRKKHKV